MLQPFFCGWGIAISLIEKDKKEVFLLIFHRYSSPKKVTSGFSPLACYHFYSASVTSWAWIASIFSTIRS